MSPKSQSSAEPNVNVYISRTRPTHISEPIAAKLFVMRRVYIVALEGCLSLVAAQVLGCCLSGIAIGRHSPRECFNSTLIEVLSGTGNIVNYSFLAIVLNVYISIHNFSSWPDKRNSTSLCLGEFSADLAIIIE